MVREVHGGHGGRFSTYIVHFYAYTTYIKSGKSHHLVNGSIAHLQSIDLRSERGGFKSHLRRRCEFESLLRHWCLFLGSMHKNANSFFINWGLWITLSPEQRLACQRTFIVSTEIHYNINNCAFPASKLEAGFISHTCCRSGSRYGKYHNFY